MPPRSVHRTAQIFGVLREPELRAVWFSEWISDAGSFVNSIALAVYVHQLTHRAAAVGLALAIRYIPGFSIGPLAGVLVDRFDRRRVMIASDLARAGLVGALPFTHLAWQAYVLTLLAQICGTAFSPARAALLPQVAPGERLVPALAVLETTHQMLHTVGPALGGLAVFLVGARSAFFLDAASFLVSAAFILRVRPRGVPAATGHSPLTELLDGVRPVLTTPAVRAYALAAMGVTVGFTGVVALLVSYVQDGLKLAGGFYGLVLGAAGLGTVLASLVIAARDDRHPRTPWIYAAALSQAVFVLALVKPSFLMLLPIALVFGLADGGLSIPVSATVAESLPDAYRGRAYGAMNAMTFLAAAVGSLLFPWLGEQAGVANAMALAAGCGAALGVLVLFLGGARAIAAHEERRLTAN
jgi:NRE family putative nickel resistance protein-like MFS transporter